MTTFRLVVANLHDDPRAVEQVLPHADYVLANECRSRAAGKIRSLDAATWRSWRPAGAGAQNPHLWRTSLVAASTSTWAQLMRGGRIGLAEAPVRNRLKRRHRRKRLGPGRAATAKFNRFTAGDEVILVGVHYPARWLTSEKWRRILVNRVVTPRLRKFLLTLEHHHPGVPIIVGGDLNAPDLDDIKLGTGWRAVRTLPDFGPRRRYTQIHYKGDVEIDQVHELLTVSDHDAPVMRVTIPARKAA